MADRKAFDNAARSGIIKSITVDDIKLAAYGKDIDSDVLDVVKKYFADTFDEERGYFVEEILVKSLKKTDGGTPLMQIEAVPSGQSYYSTRLLLNEDLFRGRSLAELDKSLTNFDANVASSF